MKKMYIPCRYHVEKDDIYIFSLVGMSFMCLSENFCLSKVLNMGEKVYRTLDTRFYSCNNINLKR